MKWNFDIPLCLYADDMLIFGTNIENVKETTKFLTSNFDKKDLSKGYVIWESILLDLSLGWLLPSQII